jgi:hypothetical protein
MLAALETMRSQLDTLASAIVGNSRSLSTDMATLTPDASSMSARLALRSSQSGRANCRRHAR